jgi:hypothetical protein
MTPRGRDPEDHVSCHAERLVVSADVRSRWDRDYHGGATAFRCADRNKSPAG